MQITGKLLDVDRKPYTNTIDVTKLSITCGYDLYHLEESNLDSARLQTAFKKNQNKKEKRKNTHVK